MFMKVIKAPKLTLTTVIIVERSETNSFFLYFLLYSQNNYPYAWGSYWLNDLLDDLAVRLYGFLPALWITLGNRETFITHEE